MTMEFSVLASGSSGNASYFRTQSFGLLIDFGLGPRQLDTRLAKIGRSWSDVQAVLLTHTHGDHWNERTLGQLLSSGISLYCHHDHHRTLRSRSTAFEQLRHKNLVLDYEPEIPIQLGENLSCVAFPVRHDGGRTFGFRLEGPRDFFGQPNVLAYAADLGSWDEHTVRYLKNADILAIEFNHDVQLQKASSRPQRTIARNLGHAGHLSNEQAFSLISTVIEQSKQSIPQHIVQLHLSESCNRPVLARGVLAPLLKQIPTLQVHSTSADSPGPILNYDGPEKTKLPSRRKTRSTGIRREKKKPMCIQPFLPGIELD